MVDLRLEGILVKCSVSEESPIRECNPLSPQHYRQSSPLCHGSGNFQSFAERSEESELKSVNPEWREEREADLTSIPAAEPANPRRSLLCSRRQDPTIKHSREERPDNHGLLPKSSLPAETFRERCKQVFGQIRQGSQPDAGVLRRLHQDSVHCGRKRSWEQADVGRVGTANHH
jgi:hypothetical protein